MKDDLVERVALAMRTRTRPVGTMLECEDLARAALAIARPAILEEEAGWRLMESAPTDGTVINVVGRYMDATAGFPRYASFMNGGWYELTKFSPQRLVCWAWRPRADWPSEPHSTGQEGGR